LVTQESDHLTNSSKNKKMGRLLHELLIDSSRSDRELAKEMGISQPTVSKMKKNLIKEGFVQGFTMIPNFQKIGYTILAFTFVKIKPLLSSSKEYQKGHEIAKNWLKRQPNVVFADYCRGMDMDGCMISFHRNYEDFDKFIKNHNQEIGYLLKDVKNILVNLAGEQTLKHFHFKYLAKNFEEYT
jgi:DNA-binding Lrp family transcriptional regulator